jgi:hypothetical protein
MVEIWNKTRGYVSVISLILLIGTQGALELGDISIGQAITRSIVLLIIFYISVKKYFD